MWDNWNVSKYYILGRFGDYIKILVCVVLTIFDIENFIVRRIRRWILVIIAIANCFLDLFGNREMNVFAFLLRNIFAFGLSFILAFISCFVLAILFGDLVTFLVTFVVTFLVLFAPGFGDSFTFGLFLKDEENIDKKMFFIIFNFISYLKLTKLTHLVVSGTQTFAPCCTSQTLGHSLTNSGLHSSSW